MQKNDAQYTIFRIIDANLNRALEGLRVCEEVLRFYLSNSRLTRRFKTLRHKIAGSLKLAKIPYRMLLKSRDVQRDVGRFSSSSELSRIGPVDILLANMQRVKESLRVLEEFSKLLNAKASEGFKEARYTLYNIEKKILLGNLLGKRKRALRKSY